MPTCAINCINAVFVIPGSQSGSKKFLLTEKHSNETHLFEIDTLCFAKRFSLYFWKEKSEGFSYLPACVGTGTYDNAISNCIFFKHVARVITITVDG